MKDSDMQRLEHMAAYCRDVADAIATYGAGFDAYCANLHFRNSVCMSIMQIGELVGGLSAEFKISTNDRIMWPLIKHLKDIIQDLLGRLLMDPIPKLTTRTTENFLCQFLS